MEDWGWELGVVTGHSGLPRPWYLFNAVSDAASFGRMHGLRSAGVVTVRLLLRHAFPCTSKGQSHSPAPSHAAPLPLPPATRHDTPTRRTDPVVGFSKLQPQFFALRPSGPIVPLWGRDDLYVV